MSSVSPLRIRALGERPLNTDGDYVLYWMIANRRTRWNPALERAVELARELGKPLFVLEALRVDYPHACPRFHRFVLDGMRDQRDAFAGTNVYYHPYVEPSQGAGRGLVELLASRAAAVVTDDVFTGFLPRMIAAAAERSPARFEAVDGADVMPVRLAPKTFLRAFDYRRFLHAELAGQLAWQPKPTPLARVVLEPLSESTSVLAELAKRWPAADASLLEAGGDLAFLKLANAVGPTEVEGGERAARRALKQFVENRLDDYGSDRRVLGVSSGLSSWLHWGQLSSAEVFAAVVRRCDWTVESTDRAARAKREGWWGLPSGPERFLDQLLTWRGVHFQWAARREDHATYDVLPEWARTTLESHIGDRRSVLYTLEQLDAAETEDPLWNATMRQLRGEGVIEGYLRMVWGKLVLQWTRTPREAWDVLVELNDRYALDGRDPNTYGAIGWVFGLFDRPWGPEREVYGKVRYMNSAGARRKLELGAYLERWGREGVGLFG